MHICTQALEHDIICSMSYILIWSVFFPRYLLVGSLRILGISTYLCLGTCGGGVALPVVLKILPNELPESIPNT